MGNKSKSGGAEAQSSNYKNSKRWESNRKRKLLKAQKAQPNNLQIAEALKNIKYRRKTPTTKFWSPTRRRIAELFKLFTGSVNTEMFSNNEKLATAALLARSNIVLKKTPGFSENTMFSIGARLSNQGT